MKKQNKSGLKQVLTYAGVAAGAAVFASGCAPLLENLNAGPEIDAFRGATMNTVTRELERVLGDNGIARDLSAFGAEKTVNLFNSVLYNGQAVFQDGLNNIGKVGTNQPRGSGTRALTATQILNGQHIDVINKGSIRNAQFQTDQRWLRADIARENAYVDERNLETMSRNIDNQYRLKQLQELATIDSLNSRDVATTVNGLGLLVPGMKDYYQRLYNFKRTAGEAPSREGLRNSDQWVPSTATGSWLIMPTEFVGKAMELNRLNFSQNDAGKQDDDSNVPADCKSVEAYANASAPAIDNSDALAQAEVALKAKGVDAPGKYIIDAAKSGFEVAKNAVVNVADKAKAAVAGYISNKSEYTA